MAPAALPPALAAVASDMRSAAVMSDFDGTLAAIVPDPEDAVALPGVVAALNALAERYAVVAVVSGRPVSFLVGQLRGAGGRLRIYGGYGLEWLEDGRVVHAPEVSPWLEPMSQLAAAARAGSPPGLGIEDKGWAVTLHWRRKPANEQWALEFASRWAMESGMILQPGRMAVELRPPLALDKGTVVEQLARRCTGACFIGDDAGDLASFDALDRLASRGVHTVRVAVADVETPPSLIERADVVVEGPTQAVELLELLAAGR